MRPFDYKNKINNVIRTHFSMSGNILHFENIIIGAGPSGLQMAYFFERDDEPQSYVILEASSSAGSFFAKYPRNRKLISVNKVNCGSAHRQHNIENIMRYDWNSLVTYEKDNGRILFRDFDTNYYPSADSLCSYLSRFEQIFNLNVWYNSKVQILNKTDNGFMIKCTRDNTDVYLSCNKCFVASGLRPQPFPDSISQQKVVNNMKLFTYETLPLDNLDLFKGKRILILGGGNAGFEIANVLNDVAHRLHIVTAEKSAWNTHYPGYLRSVNMKLLDAYYLKLQVNLDWVEDAFMRESSKFSTWLTNVVEDISNQHNGHQRYDYVIFCLGFRPSINFIESGNIELQRNSFTSLPELSPFFESVSTPNLFFIGALGQGCDWKKGTSAFIHGFRYNCKITHQYVTRKFHTQSFTSLDELHKQILLSINRSSTLLHRFDFVGDYIFVDKKSALCTYVSGVPLNTRCDDIKKLYAGKWDVLVKVFLGYNKSNTFFSSLRQPQTGTALFKDYSVLIHPIIQVWASVGEGLEKLYEYHLPEEAFNEYTSINWHRNFIIDIMHFVINGEVSSKSLQCIDRQLRFYHMSNSEQVGSEGCALMFLDIPYREQHPKSCNMD